MLSNGQSFPSLLFFFVVWVEGEERNEIRIMGKRTMSERGDIDISKVYEISRA